MKKLGDVARYHGGDLQGKQVQKLLDCARNETFEILDCIKDLDSLHAKYLTALTCLANVSDAVLLKGIVVKILTMKVWRWSKNFARSGGKSGQSSFQIETLLRRGTYWLLCFQKLLKNTELSSRILSSAFTRRKKRASQFMPQ